MKIIVFLVLLLGSCCLAAAPDPLRLPPGHDLFFVEDNLAYSRYLSLARDGTYRQIDQSRAGAVEVDRGSWEQAPDHTVALHSTYRALRFRALRSGPLTLLLDEVGKVDALPQVAASIQSLLAREQAAVFAASDAGKLDAPPATVHLDKGVESFRREELLVLAAQITQTLQTEAPRRYAFAPVRAPGGPLLLVLSGATFGPGQVAKTCRDYRVPRGSPPPFYFARTDAGTFARRVGRWRELQPVGGGGEP